MAPDFNASLSIPEHFDNLRPYLQSFLKDHPDYERNVFLMMPFTAAPPFPRIHKAIADALGDVGLKCIRADGRPFKDDLLDNVYIHMLGCKYGVVVYEDLAAKEFNPNVALELGFMLALGKRVLILKESRLHTMPTDIVGRLYAPFEAFRPKQSIKTSIQKWAQDLEIAPASNPTKVRSNDPEIAPVLSTINNLRGYFRDEQPQNEDQIVHILRQVLADAGAMLYKEQRTIPFDNKRSRPDLSSHSSHIAIKVKLCRSVAQIRSIVEEIVAEIRIFRSRYKNVIFVIYDLGFLADEPFVIYDPKQSEGVHLVVVRH